MQSEVFEAMRELGVSEDKALRAAAALSRRDDDVASLKADIAILKWMVGFALAQGAATIALLLRMGVH